jgi:hypothetical protein
VEAPLLQTKKLEEGDHQCSRERKERIDKTRHLLIKEQNVSGIAKVISRVVISSQRITMNGGAETPSERPVITTWLRV